MHWRENGCLRTASVVEASTRPVSSLPGTSAGSNGQSYISVCLLISLWCQQLSEMHAFTFCWRKSLLVYRRKYRMWIPLLFSFIRSGLLVGLEEAEGSVLCLYDLGLSRVVKAVVIPGRVSLHFGIEMLIMWFVYFCILQEFGKTAANFVCLLFSSSLLLSRLQPLSR